MSSENQKLVTVIINTGDNTYCRSHTLDTVLKFLKSWKFPEKNFQHAQSLIGDLKQGNRSTCPQEGGLFYVNYQSNQAMAALNCKEELFYFSAVDIFLETYEVYRYPDDTYKIGSENGKGSIAKFKLSGENNYQYLSENYPLSNQVDTFDAEDRERALKIAEAGWTGIIAHRNALMFHEFFQHNRISHIDFSLSVTANVATDVFEVLNTKFNQVKESKNPNQFWQWFLEQKMRDKLINNNARFAIVYAPFYFKIFDINGGWGEVYNYLISLGMSFSEKGASAWQQAEMERVEQSKQSVQAEHSSA